MKKFLILTAAAVAVFASCAKTIDHTRNTGPGDAISFGVYSPKTVTKAVSDADFGTIDNNVLGNASGSGFGVFAYYTDNNDYTSGSYYANFMYNQQVLGNGDGTAAATAWSYSPIKYWPNEHGASAISTGTDKLTFLAYAPWVDIKAKGEDSASTAKGTDDNAASEGIISMTGNHQQSDATLTFKVPASTANQVDLLYGVLKEQSVNVDGTSEGTVNSAIENLTKEKTGGKVSILFKHALAKFEIDIKEVVDQVDPESSVNPGQGVNPNWTKVVVKSLNILSTDLGTQGNLNLYTGAWNVTTTTTSFPIDPLPASIKAEADPVVAYPTVAGVIETGLGANKIDVMLIPGATSKVTGVEIVYYVCTKDDNLYGGVSIVENHITKSFDTDGSTDGNQPLTIEKGKQYNINVLLGLTSVKLTADVENWDDDDYDIDLPQNVS